MAAPHWLTARPIAHRGYHDREKRRVENTLSAAEAAVAHDFAIECDLQLTADGKAVVFHDDTADRLTDATGPIAGFTLAELKAVRLRDSDDRIPSLEEWLEAVDGRVPLLIELKSLWKGDRRLERAVAPILAGYRGPAVVMSFDPASLATMRRLLPGLPRGMDADNFANLRYWGHLPAYRRFALRHLLGAAVVAPSFISYGVHALPAPAPLLLHRLGLPLITWTIRNEADWAKSRRYGAQITFEGFDPDASPL